MKQGKPLHCHYFFFIGGRESGKTHSAEQFEILSFATIPNVYTQVLRRTDKDVKKQKKPEIMGMLNDFELIKDVDYKYNSGDMEFTFIANNNKIILDSLNEEDNPPIEGAKLNLPNLPRNIKYCINMYEEASQLNKILVDQHQLSTRNATNLEKIYIFCANPYRADDWYTELVERLLPPDEIELEQNGYQWKFIPEYEGGQGCFILRSNYRINPYISKQDIEKMEAIKRIDYERYKIVGLGMSGSILDAIYQTNLAKARPVDLNSWKSGGALIGGVDPGWTESDTACVLCNINLYSGVDCLSEHVIKNFGKTSDDYAQKRYSTDEMMDSVIKYYVDAYRKYHKPIQVFIDNASYPDFYEQFNKRLFLHHVSREDIEFLPAKKEGEYYNQGFRIDAVRYGLSAGMIGISKEITPLLYKDLFNCSYEPVKTMHEDTKPKRTHQWTHVLNALEYAGCEYWKHFMTLNSYYFPK